MIRPSEGCVTPETIFVKGLSLIEWVQPFLTSEQILAEMEKDQVQFVYGTLSISGKFEVE